MQKNTMITHKGVTYAIRVDGWFKNLDSEINKALSTIHTDDIIIFGEVKAGEFKKRAREAYDQLPDKQGLSAKQYLDKEIQAIYGRDWIECIDYLKQKIHEAYMTTVFRPDRSKKMTVDEQKNLLKAASNGHVAAMYYIGTALSDKDEDDNSAVMWLTMAHERGHLGACYELSRYFDKWGNVVDSIRCLIIAADRGMDQAYMSIFHLEHLKKIAAYQNKDEIHVMLDELLEIRPHSAARFFKCVLLLADDDNIRGIRILTGINEYPKNKIRDEDNNEYYQKQADITKKIVSKILDSIDHGVEPLVAIFNICEQSQAISYADHNEVIEALRRVHIS
ncbi:hypothetical protein OR604_12030 [Aeromonas caviae]|uniref:hypothetical protein n=1 Tax=Aeromonas caviae TaxID=648 RepID=UPI00225252F7|nr:hypothetical protein [Aeromonas caviae]MCX4036937.1 hypothetical protein [Aeromonas caviae]